MSQEQVAGALGCSRSTVSRLESGRLTVQQRQLLRFTLFYLPQVAAWLEDLFGKAFVDAELAYVTAQRSAVAPRL